MEADEGRRFEIDPRDYRRDVAYVVTLMVWGLCILGFGIACVVHEIHVLAVFAGILLLVVPWALSRRNDVHTLVVGRRHIRLLKNRDEASAVIIRRGAGIELTLENVKSGVEQGIESTRTLNLWHVDGGARRRHILGLFLSQEAKQQVFDELVEFFGDAGVEVRGCHENVPLE